MQAKLVGATLCFSRLWLQWVALTEVKTRDPSEEPLGLEGWWQWETESLHITKTVRRVRHDCPWLPEAIKFKWSVNKVKPKGLKKVKNCQFNIGNRPDAFRQRQALKLSVRIRSHRKSTPMAMSVFFFSLAFNWDSFCTSLSFPGISDRCPLAERCKHQLLGFQATVQEAVAACLLEGAVGGRWDAGSGLTSPWNGKIMRFPLPAFSCLNVRNPGLSLGTLEQLLGASMYHSWYLLTCDTCVKCCGLRVVCHPGWGSAADTKVSNATWDTVACPDWPLAAAPGDQRHPVGTVPYLLA